MNQQTHEQESEYDDESCSPSHIRPYWSRRFRKINREHEHEIDILLAGLAGAGLTALMMWKFWHP
jgi:hypothetical protein